jgi:hypothetical protein
MLLLAPTLAASGQGPAPAQGIKVYLPAVQTPALVTLEFASSVTATGEPISPTNSFSSGLDLIYVAYRLQGLKGHQFRLDFTYADGKTLAGTAFSLPSNDYRDWEAYCLTTAGSCSAGRVALPTGPYTAYLYIDGALFTQAEAQIQ